MTILLSGCSKLQMQQPEISSIRSSSLVRRHLASHQETTLYADPLDDRHR